MEFVSLILEDGPVGDAFFFGVFFVVSLVACWGAAVRRHGSLTVDPEL